MFKIDMYNYSGSSRRGPSVGLALCSLYISIHANSWEDVLLVHRIFGGFFLERHRWIDRDEFINPHGKFTSKSFVMRHIERNCGSRKMIWNRSEFMPVLCTFCFTVQSYLIVLNVLCSDPSSSSVFLPSNQYHMRLFCFPFLLFQWVLSFLSASQQLTSC